MNRFDNLSLAELFEREAEARKEAEVIADALKNRLLAECPLQIGMVYRFNKDALWHGIEFLVCSLRPDAYWLSSRRSPRYFLGVHGFRANKKSTARDGFGIRPHVIQNWSLFDLSSERVGPRIFKSML